MNNITVAIRVKPVQQTFPTIRTNGNTVILVDPEVGINNPVDILKKNRIKEASYEYDIVLDDTTEQKVVYEKTTLPLLEDLLSGQNVTIFAYGATGAGKTHTMMGNQQSYGIIPRAINDLQPHLHQAQVTYLEVYNETIRDLLTMKPLDLRDDGHQGLVVVGLFKAPANSVNDVNMLIKVGNAKRAKEPTGANENSTRSHTILQLMLPQSTLTFVDLAGSERAAQTHNRGQRMVEGAAINKSLLVLGNCIQALCQKEHFIPYRGSKLTRLLKEALVGNSKTVMIANVCPLHYEDSYNTLLYAHRTRCIEAMNFEQVIASLRSENEEIKKVIKRQPTQPKLQIMEQTDMDIQKHFEIEKSLLKGMFSNEDNTVLLQLEIIEHEKSQQIMATEKTQDLIDQKNAKIVQIENEQYDLAIKFKDQLQLRKRVYDYWVKQDNPDAKLKFSLNLQDVERMKVQQNVRRNEMKNKFKELEREYMKQKVNRNSSMPKDHSPETLKIIKKNRLLHVNKQIKEGKLVQ